MLLYYTASEVGDAKRIMADKVTEILVEALKQAMAVTDEQRLYRSGKLTGLFPSRTGAAAEAAGRALSEQLLEVTRVETKGKTAIEWVRITPQGLNFVYDRESPIRVLEEVADLLHTTREGLPLWMTQMQQEWRTAGERLAAEVRQLAQRVDALTHRVEEALRRSDVHRVERANGTDIPWAPAALAYLDKRKETGAAGRCTLPELFAALRSGHGELSIPEFLGGLRRLNDRRALELAPFEGSPAELPEPEYVMLDGERVMYYVTR
jgi:hypothetical protein